ncbi:uncharacterized protein [Anolis sagrei]|uniref:uncharacterized protein n=1 Tax=Anolis sagrei TaxID=38937 RepID=UPI00351FC43C
MPSRKNKGGPKGKGPAEKTSRKRPLRQDGSSSDEEGVSIEDLEALLQRVNQIEQNRGVGSGGAGSGPTHRASKKQLFKSLLSRVSIIESASAAGAERAVRLPEQLADPGAAGGSSVQNITSPEVHLSVQVSSGSSAAAVAGPCQPTALASTSSAVAGSTQAVGSTVAAGDVAGREQLVSDVSTGTARLVLRWRILVVSIIMSTGRRDTPGTHPLASVWVRFHCIGRVEGCSGPSLGQCSISEVTFWACFTAGPGIYKPVLTFLDLAGMAPGSHRLVGHHSTPSVAGGGDVRKLEKARKRVNRAMRTALARGRGSYIPHKDITHDKTQFYRSDGVHLTELGNANFLDDLQLGIQEVLRGLVGDGGEMDICPQSVA